MLKKLIVSAALVAGFSAQAKINAPILSVQQLQNNILAEVTPAGLPWQVGENANYKLDIGGFIEGSMVMQVRELVAEGFWIQQDIDLQFQQQKVEMLVDKDTGKLLQLLVDGKKQEIPEGKDSEIVESKPDSVTVPAGTFECTYVKLHDNKENTDTELWIDPDVVPIAGMIKQSADSQFGKVVVELTSFLKK